MVAVAQVGPEVDLPGLGPAGAPVTAVGQGLAGRRRPGGGERVGGADLAAGEERVELGGVPVGGLVPAPARRVVPVLGPLLELAAAPDPQARVEPLQGVPELLGEGGVGLPGQLGRRQGGGQQAGHDLLAHGRARRVLPVLRVVGGGDHQVPGGVGDEEVEPELGGALEDRVADVTQVLHVAGVAVVLPVGVRHPGGGLGEPGGGGPVVQAGVPPGGGLVEGHPARGARRVTEQGLGAGPAGCHEAGDEALVGRGGLGQVGGVGGPVVHLEVDIDVVVGVGGVPLLGARCPGACLCLR